jgi:hypothetical protein
MNALTFRSPDKEYTNEFTMIFIYLFFSMNFKGLSVLSSLITLKYERSIDETKMSNTLLETIIKSIFCKKKMY